MNPFAQLIAPAAFTARRLPATGAVVRVTEGVRLDPPGKGHGRKVMDAALKTAKAKAVDAEELAEAQALKRKLQRERELRWHRDRYARRKADPAYMAQKRERERLRWQDPKRRQQLKAWEAKNADRVREYKTQWIRMKRANETPEQREARRAVQREKERAYYAANKEAIHARAKARRTAKKAVKVAEKAGVVTC